MATLNIDSDWYVVTVWVTDLDTSWSNTNSGARTLYVTCGGETKSTSVGSGASSTGRIYFTNVSPDTWYTVSARIYSVLQEYDLWSDSDRIKTLAKPNPRPSNWSWVSTVSAGATIALTATEWGNFCSRINEFRTYKGLSGYPFSSVSPGDIISAAIVNEARSAINGMSGHGTLPSAAVPGGEITASFFDSLKNALNAIS